jgi:hypothetical protein
MLAYIFIKTINILKLFCNRWPSLGRKSLQRIARQLLADEAARRQPAAFIGCDNLVGGVRTT